VGDVFTLKSVYALEEVLKKIRPNNTEIKAKIRQQMQVLKHHEMVEFVNNNGVYRLLMAL
jgi:type II restriction enzyme